MEQSGFWKDRRKAVFWLTMIYGFVAHGFRLANKFYCDDSWNYMWTISRGWTVAIGRFFLPFVEVFRGKYETTWVIGVFSILCIALAAVLIVELFDIKGNVGQALTAAILVVNPAVTGTFAYMYTADGYFFGMMCSVLSAYLVIRSKGRKGIAGGAAALFVTMGLYQAYISVTILLLMLWLLLMLIDPAKKAKELLTTAGRFLGMGVAAMAAYLIGMNVAWKIDDTQMADYMGMSDAGGYSVQRLLGAVKSSYVEFARFFLVRWELNFYNASNVILLISIIVLLLWICGKRKLFAQPWRIVLLIIWGLLLPLITHIYSFISEEVSYISIIMCYSMVLIWLMPVILWQDAEQDTGSFEQWRKAEYVKKHLFQTLQSVLLVCICVHFVVIADQAYERMHLANEQIRNLVNRIQYRMELVDGYTDTCEVALYGNLYQTPEYVPSAPMMPGVVSGLYLTTQRDYSSAIDWYASSTHKWATAERRKELVHNAEFAQMQPWPAADCVKMIDGTIVILLADDEADEFGQTIKDYLEE